MDSICRIDQRSVCLRLRRVTPRSPPMQPQSSTARRRHTTAGSAAVPFHIAESASGTARNVLWSSPVSRPRAFLRNAAVSAHSRLPMHTAVVASIGTTLPEQPCPAISCAKHAKAAAVTATPSTPKSRNERSSAGKPRDSDITKPEKKDAAMRSSLEAVHVCTV